jgi:hypothetical protein
MQPAVALPVAFTTRSASAEHEEDKGAEGQNQANVLLIELASLDSDVKQLAFHNPCLPFGATVLVLCLRQNLVRLNS